MKFQALMLLVVTETWSPRSFGVHTPKAHDELELGNLTEFLVFPHCQSCAKGQPKY